MARKDSALETEICARCCGSGNYSYNQIDGSRCYGCGGTGYVFTKRGAAANRYLTAMRVIPARDFRPGDLIRYEGPGYAYFVTVQSVSCDTEQVQIDATGKIGGQVQNFRITCGADRPYRKGFSAAVKADQLKAALAYQATLNADGK